LLLEKFSLCDIWKHSSKGHGHSFQHCNGKFSSRIDCWISSSNCSLYLSKCYVDYSTGLISDHFPVISEFTSPIKINQGTGYWKLNSALLKLPETKLHINFLWNEAVESLSNCQNKHIWWENLTKMITTFFKKKGKEQMENIYN
jgi:hypothetical protein